eukprot:gene4188-6534_t
METEETSLLDQRKTEFEPNSVARPLAFSFLAALGALLFGYNLGFTSPIKDDLQDPHKGIGLTQDQQDIFGSIVNVGAMIGALSAGFFLDKLGRTKTLLIASILSVGGFLLIAFCKHTNNPFAIIMLGRVTSGISVGFVSVSVPVYIAEVAPPHLRGGMGSINQLAVTLGVLLSYSIGAGVEWQALAWIGAFIPGSLALACFFLPESPRFLVKQGSMQKATSSMRRLRGRRADVQKEINEIVESLATEEKASSIFDVFQGSSGRALVIAMVLMIFQQFSGINAVIFYSGQIFEDAGFSNSNIAALIIGSVQFVVTGISCVIVDKSGRRALLMVAGMIMAASSSMLGYFFWLQNNDYSVAGTLALVNVIIYIAGFSVGLGAIPWVIMSEIFSSRVRGIASSLSTLLNWSCSFTVTETFSPMKEAMHEQGVFWFYTAVCICGTTYVFFQLPETKGRSLEELQIILQGNKPDQAHLSLNAGDGSQDEEEVGDNSASNDVQWSGGGGGGGKRVTTQAHCTCIGGRLRWIGSIHAASSRGHWLIEGRCDLQYYA